MKQVAEIYDEGFEYLKLNGTRKCPRRYPSNEAYKYQQCYRYKNIFMDTRKISSKESSWTAYVFIIVSSFQFVILAFLVVLMKKEICEKFRKGCKQTNKNLEQNKNGKSPCRE
ncbi:uncharacterized protein LOC134266648 [Saccostrea cucullata]|uniref:uncharacterized protein LOC134266648 n=1 Tax=Saccostrea cuccullata TaxID=36930 RepID=UPI002ED5F319